ncbi:hypothetical protein ACOMHN_003606 [Nucella lapillus]
MSASWWPPHLHIKDTDAGMTLLFNSCHPRHRVGSIPYSQCLRMRRICSTDAAFCKRSQELCERLHRRGYPRLLLEAAVTKVTSILLCYTGRDVSA